MFQPFFSKLVTFLYGSQEVFGFLVLEPSQFYVSVFWLVGFVVLFCFLGVYLFVFEINFSV